MEMANDWDTPSLEHLNLYMKIEKAPEPEPRKKPEAKRELIDEIYDLLERL